MRKKEIKIEEKIKVDIKKCEKVVSKIWDLFEKHGCNRFELSIIYDAVSKTEQTKFTMDTIRMDTIRNIKQEELK